MAALYIKNQRAPKYFSIIKINWLDKSLQLRVQTTAVARLNTPSCACCCVKKERCGEIKTANLVFFMETQSLSLLFNEGVKHVFSYPLQHRLPKYAHSFSLTKLFEFFLWHAYGENLTEEIHLQ